VEWPGVGWDQLADTSVSTGNTWWNGLVLVKTASSDGNWYFHVRSANTDNSLNTGGTVHYGPYNRGTVHYGPYNIDSNSPFTAHDANSDWRKNDLVITLLPVDNASGVNATYYCTDSDNTCTPATSGTSVSVSCSANSTCQSYARFYSTDLAGNSEEAKSLLVKIDKQAPGTPILTDEGSISSDFVLAFTYSTGDNNGSGVNDFFIELRTGGTDGDLVYSGWTGESDGSYDYLGALEAYNYYAKGKVRDALGQESPFSDWTDGLYVNVTAHPASSNYALDMYVVVPSDQASSSTYSVYDLVVGQDAVVMSSTNFEAETGFAGGFIENASPTIAFNSPNSGYYSDTTISIDFNLIEPDGETVFLDLAYSLSSGAFSNSLLDDVNVQDYANVSGLSCDDAVFSDATNCEYSWSTASVQDNNYFFDFNAWDSQGLSHTVSSIGSVSVDKTAPSTSSDYNSDWSGVDLNVTLSCSDSSAGCSSTQYRLDSNPSKAVSFGAWLSYSVPFEVSGDGNWAIDFNSTDSIGNTETTNREYVLINRAFSSMQLEDPAGFEIHVNEDMNKQLWYRCIDYAGNVQDVAYIWICLDRFGPTTTLDFNSDWRNSDLNVSFSATDAASGVDVSYYCSDDSNSCSPSSGSSGSQASVACAQGSACQTYLRWLSVDKAGNAETAQGRLVRIDKQNPNTSVSFVAGWQGNTVLTFTCADGSGSGCKSLVYRMDSGDWNTVAFTGNDVNVHVSSDGNHLIEFYSLDNVDNNHAVSSGWQAVDKSPPSLSITDPSTDNMEKGTLEISFNIGRISGSTLNISSFVVDFNGTISDDFNALSDCTQNSAGDYNCSYTELGLIEEDYNLSVYSEDTAGNSRKRSRVFTYRPIVAVRNVTPSGGFASGDSVNLQFEVKNTMLNALYVELHVTNWFDEFDNDISGILNLDNHAVIEGLSCDDTIWWDWTSCTYLWDSSAAADGNYFVDVNMWTVSGTVASGHSTQQFILDNTAPVARIGNVSPTPVYSNRVYLNCFDEIANFLDITTDHDDFICLWVEDRAGFNHYAASPRLNIETAVFVVSSIPSQTQSVVTQDLNNECTMYVDQGVTVECDFKSTLKISEWGKDLNRVYQEKPEIVQTPPKTIRVLVQNELEAFYHKDYFLRFESDARTITSQGEEKDYPTTVVRRRVIPLITTSGQLEIGTLIIKIRQR